VPLGGSDGAPTCRPRQGQNINNWSLGKGPAAIEPKLLATAAAQALPSPPVAQVVHVGTKLMHWQILLAMSVLTALLSAEPPAEKAARQERQQLQGTWTFVRVELGGKQLPNDLAATGTLTITGTRYTLRLFGLVADEGTITIDPAKDPKAWDKVSTKFKGTRIAGIYDVCGDALMYCESPTSMERPTEIVSRKGTLESSATLKRK
jgi:uncharacterized protein (TIGR03067 family)